MKKSVLVLKKGQTGVKILLKGPSLVGVKSILTFGWDFLPQTLMKDSTSAYPSGS